MEYSGTYVSFNPHFSARFAVSGGLKHLLMEIRLPKGSPKLCGHNLHEWELVVGSVPGSEIKAIYELDNELRVIKVHKNPNYIMHAGEATVRYNVGDVITEESVQEGIERYNQLHCAAHIPLEHVPSADLKRAHEEAAKHFLQERKFVHDTCKRLDLFEDYGVCAKPE